MIIDVHTHLFSPEIRENRSRYFPGESAFKLLYDSPKSKLAGAGEMLAMMDAEGVDQSVIFGFPWRNPEVFKRENDYILETVAKHPDRFIGLCCLDAMNPEAPKEAERCLNAGLSGVGELAFYESGISLNVCEALEPILEVCREKRLPALVHTNEPVGHFYPGKSPNTLAQIYHLIKRFPENIFILAHWGAGIFFYNLLKKETREVLKNVYYDTAASPFLYEAAIYSKAVELAGVEKVLFGTDYPLLKPARYFKDMAASGISESDQAAICGGNAARLFNRQ
jgi:uncharacterized protein